METSELPQFDNPEYLTAEGLEEIKKELEERKQNRQEIAKIIESAREQGDLMENTEYDSAKNRQGENESRIIEIENIIRRVVIISKESGNDIKIGSSIRLKKEESNMIEEYFLVGPEETNPLEGKISYKSPLGSALLQKTKDTIIKISTPNNNEIKYTIIDVR
jgi:transcription elongation factor GreA